MTDKELIESMWCNCGLDCAEPKYHSTDCTYRVEWEDAKGTVHMTAEQRAIAERLTGWKSWVVNHYDPDFLDIIAMQMEERAYHYGTRKGKGAFKDE